jgi:hypothetical protein
MRLSTPCQYAMLSSSPAPLYRTDTSPFDCRSYSYTLPLLPGYGANVKVRSSVAPKSPGGGSILHKMDAAEEVCYLKPHVQTGTFAIR